MHRSVLDDFEYYMYQIQGELPRCCDAIKFSIYFLLQAPEGTWWRSPTLRLRQARKGCWRSWLSTDSCESFSSALFSTRFSENTIYSALTILLWEHVMRQLLRNSENRWSSFCVVCCLIWAIIMTIKSFLNWRRKCLSLLGVFSLKWAKSWWKLAFLSGIVFKFRHEGCCLCCPRNRSTFCQNYL